MGSLVKILALIGALLGAVPAGASTLPDPVEQALREAEAHADLRLSFTLVFQWADGPEIVERYNASSGRWTVLKGDPNALDATARGKLAHAKRLEAMPGGLVAADYRKSIAGAELISMSPVETVYRFQAPRQSKVAENVQAELGLGPLGGLTRYSIRTDEKIEPTLFMRFDKFVFEHHFERVFADLPPLLTRAVICREGSTLRRAISEDYVLLFKDFERVE